MSLVEVEVELREDLVESSVVEMGDGCHHHFAEEDREEGLFCTGALVEDQDGFAGLDHLRVEVDLDPVVVDHFHKEARVALNQLRVCLLHLWE